MTCCTRHNSRPKVEHEYELSTLHFTSLLPLHSSDRSCIHASILISSPSSSPFGIPFHSSPSRVIRDPTDRSTTGLTYFARHAEHRAHRHPTNPFCGSLSLISSRSRDFLLCTTLPSTINALHSYYRMIYKIFPH